MTTIPVFLDSRTLTASSTINPTAVEALDGGGRHGLLITFREALFLEKG